MLQEYKTIIAVAEFLVDGGGADSGIDDAEIQELRTEFIEDLYPTL